MKKDKKDTAISPYTVGVQGPYYNYAITDPMGSYTGVPISSDEVPVQDADDL